MNLNPLMEAARKTGGKLFFSLSVPMNQPHGPEDEPETQTAGDSLDRDPKRCTHTPNFECVNWFREVYTFTPKQAVVVAELWGAWKNRTPFLRQEGLLLAADSESLQLLSIFGNHPAWGTMIQSGRRHGGKSGTYCLFPLPERF